MTSARRNPRLTSAGRGVQVGDEQDMPIPSNYLLDMQHVLKDFDSKRVRAMFSGVAVGAMRFSCSSEIALPTTSASEVTTLVTIIIRSVNACPVATQRNRWYEDWLSHTLDAISTDVN